MTAVNFMSNDGTLYMYEVLFYIPSFGTYIPSHGTYIPNFGTYIPKLGI